jgi:hypothetical protein
MLALPHHIDTMLSPAAGPEEPGSHPAACTDFKATSAAAAVAGQVPPASAAAFPLGVAPAGPESAAGFSSDRVVTSQLPQGSGRTALDYGVYAMTVRGPQVPVVGSSWVLQEQAVQLTNETEAAKNVKDPAWRTDIERSLVVRLQLHTHMRLD